MSKLLTLDDLNFAHKQVFVRVDYNVVENGKVVDPFRIEASLPTLQALLKKNCSLVLASHNGRPEGKVDPQLSLRPVAQVLADLIKRPVGFVKDCVGAEVAEEAHGLKPGELLLLENLRFHMAEEKDNQPFARSLAHLAQVYVDDAFANAHRAHASMVGVPKYLPHAAGLLMAHEYKTLSGLLQNPMKPFVAVIGGVKISTKIEVLHNLLNKVDCLVLGGAMANTFLQAQGYDVGKSVTEPDYVDVAKEIMQIAEHKKVKIILPIDVVVANKAETKVAHHTVDVDKIAKNDMVLDIGKKTMKSIWPVLKGTKTIFWNGTLGMAEIPEFAWASRDLAHMISIKKRNAETVIGGGDTAAFIDQLGMHKRFGFVSTGGGASLELLAQHPLPAIEVLLKK